MKPLARAGVWQVDCESCRVPIRVELKQKTAVCLNARIFSNGVVEPLCPDFDKPKSIEWPKDILTIEKLLRKALPEDQYYHSIWSAKQFAAILNDPNHTVGP